MHAKQQLSIIKFLVVFPKQHSGFSEFVYCSMFSGLVVDKISFRHCGHLLSSFSDIWPKQLSHIIYWHAVSPSSPKLLQVFNSLHSFAQTLHCLRSAFFAIQIYCVKYPFNVTRLKMTLTQRSADHSQSQRLFLWSFLYSEIVPYTVSCIRQLHHFTLHPAYPFSLKRPIRTPRTHYVARFGRAPRLLNIDRPANVTDNGTHCCLVFTCSKRSL